MNITEKINELSISRFGYSLEDIYNLYKRREIRYVKTVLMAVLEYHYNQDILTRAKIFSCTKPSICAHSDRYEKMLNERDSELLATIKKLPRKVAESITSDNRLIKKGRGFRKIKETPFSEKDIEKFDLILKDMYNGNGLEYFRNISTNYKEAPKKYFAIVYLHAKYRKNINNIEEILGMKKYNSNGFIKKLRYRIKDYEDIAFKILNDLDLKYYNVIYDFLTKPK